MPTQLTFGAYALPSYHADSDPPQPSFTRRLEAGGLDALIRGFQLSVPDDHEKLVLTRPVCDALIRLLPGEGRRTASASGRSAPQTPLHASRRDASGRRRRH